MPFVGHYAVGVCPLRFVVPLPSEHYCGWRFVYCRQLEVEKNYRHRHRHQCSCFRCNWVRKQSAALMTRAGVTRLTHSKQKPAAIISHQAERVWSPPIHTSVKKLYSPAPYFSNVDTNFASHLPTIIVVCFTSSFGDSDMSKLPAPPYPALLGNSALHPG